MRRPTPPSTAASRRRRAIPADRDFRGGAGDRSEGSWRHGRETAHCINRQAEYAAAHRRIAAAIAERNPTLAEEAMRAHLSGVQQQLIEHAFPRLASVRE
jgi:hypothetical protein